MSGIAHVLGAERHEVPLRPHGDVVIISFGTGTGLLALPALRLRLGMLSARHGLPGGLGLANVPSGRCTLLLGCHGSPLSSHACPLVRQEVRSIGGQEVPRANTPRAYLRYRKQRATVR